MEGNGGREARESLSGAIVAGSAGRTDVRRACFYRTLIRRMLTRPAAGLTTGVDMSGLTYETSGVDYEPLDAFKRACQRQAATTAGALAAHGLSEPKYIRGESAFLIETPDA